MTGASAIANPREPLTTEYVLDSVEEKVMTDNSNYNNHSMSFRNDKIMSSKASNQIGGLKGLPGG